MKFVREDLKLKNWMTTMSAMRRKYSHSGLNWDVVDERGDRSWPPPSSEVTVSELCRRDDPSRMEGNAAEEPVVVLDPRCRSMH